MRGVGGGVGADPDRAKDGQGRKEEYKNDEMLLEIDQERTLRLFKQRGEEN
jgi:hypothetical protein